MGNESREVADGIGASLHQPENVTLTRNFVVRMWCSRAVDGQPGHPPDPPATPLPGKTTRADDGTRTRDPHLGKVMLYQLSHVRVRVIVAIVPGTGRATALGTERVALD